MSNSWALGRVGRAWGWAGAGTSRSVLKTLTKKMVQQLPAMPALTPLHMQGRKRVKSEVITSMHYCSGEG